MLSRNASWVATHVIDASLWGHAGHRRCPAARAAISFGGSPSNLLVTFIVGTAILCLKLDATIPSTKLAGVLLLAPTLTLALVALMATWVPTAASAGRPPPPPCHDNLFRTHSPKFSNHTFSSRGKDMQAAGNHSICSRTPRPVCTMRTTRPPF